MRPDHRARLNFHARTLDATLRVQGELRAKVLSELDPAQVPQALFQAQTNAVLDVKRWLSKRTAGEAVHTHGEISLHLSPPPAGIGAMHVSIHHLVLEATPPLLPEAENTYDSQEPRTLPTLVPASSPTTSLWWIAIAILAVPAVLAIIELLHVLLTY